MIKGYDLGTRARRFGPKGGFTIVELIVVIVVMGILASVTIIGYGSWKHSTLSAAVKSDLNGVVSAMEDYRTFNNDYPSSIPTTFIPSSGVSLTVDASSTATDYCINGVSTKDTSITFYVASAKKDQGAIQGTCADLTGVTAPGVPSNLVATSFAGSSVSLAWNAVAGAGNNYTAQCSYDAVFINNLQQSTQSTTSATLSSFTPSTIYCRVNATNAAGSSSWSSTITSTASLLNGLVAWYPFSGNAKDATSNGNNGVVNGANLTYGIDGNVNSAYSFNGSTAYISVPDNDMFTLSNFTLSFWVKTANTAPQRIIEKEVSGQSSYGILIVNSKAYLFLDGSWGSHYIKDLGPILTDNAWHLVTATRSGSLLTLYVDGASVGTRPNSTTSLLNNSTALLFGKRPNNIQYLYGIMDDARIYNRALSASEVSSLYDSYAPESTLNGLAGWWPLNGNVVDASGNGNNGAVSGATLTTGQNGQSNSAYAFNGLSQSIQLPTTHNVSYGTVSLWVKPSPTQPTANYFIFSNPESSTNSRVYILTNSDGTAIIGALGNGTTVASTSTTSNTWHHVVVTWSGTNGGMYLDGVNVTTVSAFNGLTSKYATTFLGCINSNAECFSGSIDDVRVYDRVISSGEVSYLYGLGAR